MEYQIIEVERGHKIWCALLEAAPTIGEATVKQLTMEMDWIKSNHILVAVSDAQPVGVLRLVAQRLGEDEDRPPIVFRGETLIEGKVISFGVVPEYRRRGIGRALQEKAIELAREEGCYQLRSRSWYHSQANFHLKISMGSGIQPSLKDDSVYFVIVLQPPAGAFATTLRKEGDDGYTGCNRAHTIGRAWPDRARRIGSNRRQAGIVQSDR